jgi:hypothetical protein
MLYLNGKTIDSDVEMLPAMNCKNWEVRYEVADRIDTSHLPKMMKDKHARVRQAVARRIDVSHLPRMMKDKHEQVRLEVAKRIDLENALLMSETDKSKQVRETALNRVRPCSSAASAKAPWWVL